MKSGKPLFFLLPSQETSLIYIWHFWCDVYIYLIVVGTIMPPNL